MEKLQSEGFVCKGGNGSFYKKEKDFTFRIATHKEHSPDSKIVITMLYETIEELYNIKTNKFRKLKEKYLRRKKKENQKKGKRIEKKGKERIKYGYN